jgi:hypothetical protein
LQDERLEAAFDALKEGEVDDVRVLINDLRRTALPLLVGELTPRLRPRLAGRPRQEQQRVVRDAAERAHREAAADALTLVVRGDVATIDDMREAYRKSMPYAVLLETVRMGET